MLFGPVFTREVTIVPRREWTYIVRSIYAGLLLLLTATAWLVISGTQLITDTGDFARFGAMLFQFIAPVQLVLSVFFAAVLAASAVGQEKERKTLLLLLLTDMSNSELVLGKLMASLLNILMMLAVSIPVLMSIAILGGVSYCQIASVLLVTVFSMLLCGSIGSCIALWRDKTFQAIAATILVIVLYIAAWIPVGYGLFGQTLFGISTAGIAAAFSPWNAVIAASRPVVDTYSANPFLSVFAPIAGFLCVCGGIAVLVNLIAIFMVRVWNPSRETLNTAMEDDTWIKQKSMTEQTLAEALTVDAVAKLEEQRTLQALAQKELTQEERQLDRQQSAAITAEGGRVRHVWNNPVIWREIMTRAYGRKIWIIQFGFLAFFAMCAMMLYQILT
ncbi:MAG: ABC transporter permease subunit, partial [Planctomycetaceae bacterium]|nr:ABC transporter permease subunit [Planctomycetaceae bacterium]